MGLVRYATVAQRELGIGASAMDRLARELDAFADAMAAAQQRYDAAIQRGQAAAARAQSISGSMPPPPFSDPLSPAALHEAEQEMDAAKADAAADVVAPTPAGGGMPGYINVSGEVADAPW